MSRNCFTNFLLLFQSVVTYITVTVTNISNSIIKQYYVIIKLFKVLVIEKKYIYILIYDRSITLTTQAFFGFKNILMMSVCQDGKFIKGWDIIADYEIVTNCTLFWWFYFSKRQGWYPNMFSRPNFQVSVRLIVIGRIAPSTRIFINHSRH